MSGSSGAESEWVGRAEKEQAQDVGNDVRTRVLHSHAGRPGAGAERTGATHSVKKINSVSFKLD
jgi:hypothetical protein